RVKTPRFSQSFGPGRRRVLFAASGRGRPRSDRLAILRRHAALRLVQVRAERHAGLELLGLRPAPIEVSFLLGVAALRLALARAELPSVRLEWGAFAVCSVGCGSVARRKPSDHFIPLAFQTLQSIMARTARARITHYVRVFLASKTLRTVKSKKFVKLGLNPVLSCATNRYLRR